MIFCPCGLRICLPLCLDLIVDNFGGKNLFSASGNPAYWWHLVIVASNQLITRYKGAEMRDTENNFFPLSKEFNICDSSYSQP